MEFVSTITRTIDTWLMETEKFSTENCFEVFFSVDVHQLYRLHRTAETWNPSVFVFFCLFTSHEKNINRTLSDVVEGWWIMEEGKWGGEKGEKKLVLPQQLISMRFYWPSIFTTSMNINTKIIQNVSELKVFLSFATAFNHKIQSRAVYFWLR